MGCLLNMLMLSTEINEVKMSAKSQIRLLLVEDDEVDVMNVKRALKKNNLTTPVHHVSDGYEALELLDYWQFSEFTRLKNLVILLDLNMPKMNGLEFLKQLRENRQFSKIPVIVLTTSNQQKDLVAAYDLNVAGYIVKPMDFQEFVETINTLSRYWSICEMPE